ncbi:YqaA family protein [Pseudomonas plecoglossicida]|uniref:YqaA family protein n=1 Tax=Pseudomonas plecoglossicida TaxID=70775 RepID=UPI003D239F93
MLSYGALFLSAFGAATLLPLQSEAVLVGLLLRQPEAWLTLLLIATAGNVLGSMVNWLLGRAIEHLRDKRWFPFSASQLERAQLRYQRWGQWSLLLSWMPVIGDPLTLIAGIMREPFWRFMLLVTLAKGGRYIIVALITLGWFDTW